jgi:hypothetical protein
MNQPFGDGVDNDRPCLRLDLATLGVDRGPGERGQSDDADG